MGLESSFEKPKNESGLEKKETEEKGPIFEVKKKLGKIDVSIGIERGKEPLSGSIDFENKEAKIRVTPEGIIKGVKAINEFFKDPKNREKLEKFNNKWEGWINRKKEQREDKKAEQTIKDYAEQEGKEETVMVEELLEELGGRSEERED